jgi:hypothetical protein
MGALEFSQAVPVDKLVIVCIGLIGMCCGFWMAGYRYLTTLVVLLLSFVVIQLCLGKLGFAWEPGWVWHGWNVIQLALWTGSLLSLLMALLIIRDMISASMKQKKQKLKSEHQPSDKNSK